MIRWIVEGVLGTAAYDSLGEVDVIVLDARYLVDRTGNAPDRVGQLISRGVQALEDGKTVVVACDFGVSRSNAVAAGILSSWKNLDFDASVQMVVERTGEENIKLDMIETVRHTFECSQKNELKEAILVTGGTGFLGKNLVAALAAQLDSVILSPSRSDLDLLGSSTSIAAYVKKNNIAQIIHLAYPRIYTNIPAMGESLTMLRNLIEVSVVHDVRLVTLSGAPVFSGYETSSMRADLNLPPKPRHIYGETKFLEEALVRAVMETGRLNASIVRLAPTYGPGGERPRLIQHFYEAIVAGREIETHNFINGPARLELLYIDDAVDALCEIIVKNLNGHFHIGSGLMFSPAQVAQEISIILGKPCFHVSTDLVDFVSNIALGCQASQSNMTWTPKIELRQGLAKTLGTKT